MVFQEKKGDSPTAVNRMIQLQPYCRILKSHYLYFDCNGFVLKKYRAQGFMELVISAPVPSKTEIEFVELRNNRNFSANEAT